MFGAGYYAPAWSVLNVTGGDAPQFLHSFCTNDVKGLAAGAVCEALFTNVKGHVVAHAVLCRHETSLSVVVTSDRAQALAEHLDRYHIREDVELEVVEATRVLLTTDQGAAEEIVPEVTWRALPGLGEGAAISLGADPAWAETRNSAEWRQFSEQEFTAWRIDRLFPLDGVDVDEGNLPQELGRDADLISFTKGCYLGQETVARIDALGRVNRVLTRLEGQGDAGGLVKPGDELLVDEKAVGRVTSVAAATDAAPARMLAYVRREHLAPGTKLATAGGGVAVVV